MASLAQGSWPGSSAKFWAVLPWSKLEKGGRAGGKREDVPGRYVSVPTTPGGATCPLVCVRRSAGAPVLGEARPSRPACGVRVLLMPVVASSPPCPYLEQENEQAPFCTGVCSRHLHPAVCQAQRRHWGWAGPRLCSQEPLIQGGMPTSAQRLLCVLVPAVGVSDSSPNPAAPVMPGPWGEGFPGESGEEGRLGSRAGSQKWSAWGSMPAIATCPRAFCRPQHGAALQPWRLRPCDPGSQHGQQYRQPPSQGQGVQPAPQPGAHGELTAGPPGPHCLPGRATAKRADMKVTFSCPLSPGQVGWALLAPLSSPDSWAQEATEMPAAPCLQRGRLWPMTFGGGWARGGAGGHERLHLFCVLKPKSFRL